MSKNRSASSDPDSRELLKLETNLVIAKNSGGEIKVHLVYPNSYWVAMSNLGFQAVYSLFAAQEGIAIERGFLPDDALSRNEQHEVSGGRVAARDEHGSRREKEKPWRTFEQSTIMSDCDVLGFSLSFETDYLHLLRILNNQGLLATSPEERDRMSEGKFSIPLIIVGGTAVTLNPEPIADFVDVIVLGEAEELIPEFTAVVKEAKRRGYSRQEMLAQLSQVEGVYVPRFFKPHYNADESIKHFEALPIALNEAQITPARPQRRFVKDLSKFPTYSRVLTPETEFKSMFLTETGRGCEMGCRFCVAGYIYRPVRKRSEESIADTVKIGLENSDAVGFVGASVSSHKSIAKLAKSVADQGGRASLSSLMSQKVSKELAASLSESEYKTVALAPEAGSERLRRAAGKRVTNQQVIDAALHLAQAGIKGFKLYFIAGLPTEEDADLDAIAELAIAIRNAVVEASRESGQVAWVQLSVNPFIPKASTPFQWEPMLAKKILEKKIERIRNLIKRTNNLEMRFEPPKESYFQALLSRGDRRVAKLLHLAEVSGKDWKWLMSKTKERILPEVPAIDFYVVRRIPYEQPLPWEIVDSRIDRKLLMRESMRATLGEDFVLPGESEMPSQSAL